MEINDANVVVMVNYLEQTLSPQADIRKPAEKFLESVERNKNYPLLLLFLMRKEDVNPAVRVAGAVAFKNYIKRNWRIVDGDNRIHEDDRVAIKNMIVDLMLKSPEAIQRQLSDSVSVIGQEDFPQKWPGLMKEMVEKFSCGDFHVINGVLRTAHSLFKRYRHEFRSDGLFREILLVLTEFAQPFTELFINLLSLSKQHEQNSEATKVIYNSILTVTKIFYSLNCQDLPEYFEDNMNTWMPNFHALLIVENPYLKTDGEEEAGTLELLKSQICDNIAMYAQKYDEEFAPYLPVFVEDVWNLLVNTGNQPKYDMLVSNAIQFLAMVAAKQQYRHLFQDSNTMSSICEKVIIPNMQFRQADEELFEDNPEEYIRRDIEGSDIDTRRRASCDLVKALATNFESEITEIFVQYVKVMLSQYATDPAKNWRSKDAAIYLITSLTAKAQTSRHGITQTNQLVNILDFYQQQILPELENPNVNDIPVLKADAIKYVTVFRSQLPPQVIKQCIPNLVRFLKASAPVLHSYAACALEKILILKLADNSATVKAADLKPFSGELLANLFDCFNNQPSKENEYVMKAVMRSLSTLQQDVIPYMDKIVTCLTNCLIQVSKNPSKPHFNHYLFESLCLCIRITCQNDPSSITKFEGSFFPLFQGILQQDVTEFIPYIFQILSLMLETHSASIPEPYMALFPFLLNVVLWGRPSNIHPLVSLLQSYIFIGPQQVVACDKLNAILGIYQKLISSKSNDHQGFYLIQSIIENLPEAALSEYVKPIFVLLFQRLSSLKSTKFIKGLLVFFGVYMMRFGGPNFVQVVDSLEPKLTAKVLDRLFISEAQKISGNIEKKICAIGMVKLLCETPEIVSGEYANYWPPLLQALIALFELPEDDSVPEDEHFVEIEDTPGYQAAYVQLNFVGKRKRSLLHEKIPDAKLYLAQSLGKLSVANPGRIQPLTSTINPKAQEFLTRYLQLANVQLV